MNNILESTKFVVDNSKDVRINPKAVRSFANNFTDDHMPHWLAKSPLTHTHLNDAEKLNLLLIFNSTSFCYWGDPSWEIEYNGAQYGGSWGMIACILKAFDEGKPIFNTKYRARLSLAEYGDILRGTVEIPLLQERYAIITEVAKTLQEKYSGDFANLLEEGKGDGLKVLDLIISSFPSFTDVRTYNNQTVYFYKRAQLLVEDIYQTFGGIGFGALVNMDQFTACADYKLPQSLRKLDIFSYSKELAATIDRLVLIPANDPREVEIRANTIWAVEMIRQELVRQGKIFSSTNINDHLWLMGQIKTADEKPYHRTRTTAY